MEPCIYRARCPTCGEHLSLAFDFYWWLICAKCDHKEKIEGGENEECKKNDEDRK
jgi:hypothetical protein